MSKPNAPKWEDVLSAASRLQQSLPDAVLVGGTAAAMYAHHRKSYDADHTIGNLGATYATVLATLEATAGWSTAPVLILDSLNGIDTGERQLRRSAPLETQSVTVRGETITVPTEAEILRIKGFLIIQRNKLRDYLDFAALASQLGDTSANQAMSAFDR